ncbi:nuclear transport factor 2 family protein [Verticiella sediminum]|uniref:Nuclear transport factor 2 family protein n=1 Tax=Verticiella sediminum TaxID=1247510 RepID=A0A556AVM5_9BURK|nr:nuclear transport factor 2 family protein [Verticiella sediminum]TSH96445.1 nuclear transport factor 2 family protein [Verticiella sediminum]
MNAAIAQTLQAWHRYLRSNDAAELRPLVADDVVFRSPVAHSPYPGPEAIVLVLTTVNTVFENFQYHREFFTADGLSVGLEFSAEIDGKALKGIDLIRFDPDGKIAEFEVMVRPASGLAALQAAMGARLAQHKATLTGAR